jgi:hypothetical protein
MPDEVTSQIRDTLSQRDSKRKRPLSRVSVHKIEAVVSLWLEYPPLLHQGKTARTKGRAASDNEDH